MSAESPHRGSHLFFLSLRLQSWRESRHSTRGQKVMCLLGSFSLWRKLLCLYVKIFLMHFCHPISVVLHWICIKRASMSARCRKHGPSFFLFAIKGKHCFKCSQFNVCKRRSFKMGLEVFQFTCFFPLHLLGGNARLNPMSSNDRKGQLNVQTWSCDQLQSCCGWEILRLAAFK